MKVLISGYYGQGNAGDEALLISLLEMLPSKVEAIVLSANPKETQKNYGVKTYPHRSIFLLLEALKISDIFIWGGGSLIQDVTSLLSPIYYAGLMYLAQKKGLKTIAWGQGIGPLNHKFTRWMTRKVLTNCTAISVRDYNSAKLLSKWNINFFIAPDPVWQLSSKSITSLSEIPIPRVAVNLRNHSLLTPQRLNVLTQALVNFQKITNAYILLVPFQASQDLEITYFISKQLKQFNKIIQLNNPQELKGIFRNVEMTIGMRLHCLIMAASEECRCFALSYDPKVKSLMKEINIPGWELDKLPNNPDIIKNAWSEYFFNGKSLTANSIEDLKKRALLHRELLIKVISK